MTSSKPEQKQSVLMPTLTSANSASGITSVVGIDYSLVVHCKQETYEVYIGRGVCPLTGEEGKWGNPIILQSEWERVEVLGRYRRWLYEEIQASRISIQELAWLKGKVLGCWCAPRLCHGHILVAVSNWAWNILQEQMASCTCELVKLNGVPMTHASRNLDPDCPIHGVSTS